MGCGSGTAIRRFGSWTRTRPRERCEPGTWLRSVPEPEQDVIIAKLLRRMWRVPPAPHPFRPLAEMIALWVHESRENEAQWPDPGLVREGLQMFEDLVPAPEADQV